jgi:hypothetical protein
LSITSPRLSKAVRAYQEARQELVAALLAEQPGRAVIARHNAFLVTTGPRGVPALVVVPHVRLKRSKSASSSPPSGSTGAAS